jgi:hypothetical protein
MKHLVWLFILISSSVYASGIYTWVDEEGEIHYGDARPMSVHSEEVRVDVAPNNPGEPLPRLGAGDAESSAPDSSTTASNTPDSAQPDSEMSDEQAAAICKQAHYQLKVVNKTRHRARARNPDGTSRHMTTDERIATREQAKQDIAEYCK